MAAPSALTIIAAVLLAASSLGAVVAALLAMGGVARAQAPQWDYVLSVNSDYDVSGRVAVVGVLPPWDVDDHVASVHSDAEARYHDGLVYVVNHLYADNIQVLDPSQGFATTIQFSLGPGTNPQDIAFASGTRVYVSRYESTHLLEVDPTTGAVTDSVDLSPLADADGIPEMSGMALVDGILFVAVQRLDRDYYWTPVAPSYLAVLDTSTNTLVDVDAGEPGVQGIELPLLNPYRDLLVDGETGLIYVACSGAWGSLDGGIVEVDPASLDVTGVISTESQLGGELYDFTLPLGGRAHAVVSTSSPSWEQFCVAFDWGTGAKIENVWKPGGYSVMDVEVHEGSGQLFLADRTYADPGVRVFDAHDGSQLTSSPLAASLPPHDLLVVGDAVASAEPVETPRHLALSPWPNPTAAGVSVGFRLPDECDVSVAVYDPAGRVVRRLDAQTGVSGWNSVVWDGRGDDGRRATAGVYLARVEAGGLVGSAKLVLVR